MASPSPPKPWERPRVGQYTDCLLSTVFANASYTVNTAFQPQPGGPATPVVRQRSTALATPSTTTAPGTSQPPSLPPRPPTLNVNRTAANYSPYGNGPRLAPTPYGGIGGYGNYTSPYSRFGAMGNSMYGGYGSMYGGIGGMGGMYGGMGGRMGMDPNDPNSLTNSFSQSTQATFQIIESLVGAFGGFAQMLESTYMATHSSFFGELFSGNRFRRRTLTTL